MDSAIKTHRLDSAIEQHFKPPLPLPPPKEVPKPKDNKLPVVKDISKKILVPPQTKEAAENPPKPKPKIKPLKPPVKKENPQPSVQENSKTNENSETDAVEELVRSKIPSIKPFAPLGFALPSPTDSPEEKAPTTKENTFHILAIKLVEDVAEKIRRKIYSHHHVCTKDPYIEHNEIFFWNCAQDITFESHTALAKLYKRFELASKSNKDAAYQELAFFANEQLKKAFMKIERIESIWSPIRFWRWLRWDRPDPDLDTY